MAALITWSGHNVVDDATLSVTLGAVDTSFPLSNLKLRGLAEEFRSDPTGPGNLNIVVDNLLMPYERRDYSFAPAVNGEVYAVLAQPDGKFIIGGNFSAVGGVARSYIARLNADGTLDTGFNPNANFTVRAIALQPDGKIVIGGGFTTVGGTARNGVARLNADGTLDTTFNPGTGADGQVNAVAVHTLAPYAGRVVIGGSFTSVNGTMRNRIARLNANGTLDTGFNPNASGTVEVLLIDIAAGNILVGGNFTTIGGSTRNYIARFAPAGSLDASFNPNANASVTALAERGDGWIYVGGGFTTIGGYSRSRLARISTSGTVDIAFWPPTINNSVSTIALPPTGGVVIGGHFLTVGGISRRQIARLEDDGTLDPNFIGPNSGIAVYALALMPGAVCVGGLNSVHGHLFKLRLQSPNEVGLFALLGLSTAQFHNGDVVLQHRPSLSAAWVEAARQSLPTFRRGLNALPPHLGIPLPAGIPASSQFRIIVVDGGMAPFAIGRLWIGETLALGDGIDAGWSMGFRDSGSLEPTQGQQWVESPGVITRVLSIPLEGARDTETHWGFKDGSETVTQPMSLNAMQLEAGTTGEVIAIARTSTALWTSRTLVYGHIESPWAIGHQAGPYWSAALTLVEER